MRVLKDFIKWYFYITTGILFVVAGNLALVGAEKIPGNTLWQILISGFITTLVTVTLLPREGKSKVPEWFGIILHYLGLCVTMVISGYWFGWINLNPAGICLMMVSVALVYIIVFGVYYLLDVKQADEINRKLKEKYSLPNSQLTEVRQNAKIK